MEHTVKMEVWVGIDWGDQKHAVAIVAPDGEALEGFWVADSPEGYAQLSERLARYETVGGIALEATRNMLLLHLHETGYPLYLINPKMSKAWRDTDGVSGAKSDPRDGLTLARGLAFRHKRLASVSHADPAMERLALLCEKECAQIHKRTALVQELKSTLKQYYPAALGFFNDWTSPAAWDFLKAYPSARRLARAKAHTLIAWLKAHRLGWTRNWQEKVKTRGNAAAWPIHPHEDIYQLQVQAIVGQLKALAATLKQFRVQIEAAFSELPEAAVIASLPGAGPKLAPRVAAIVGSPEAQHGGLEAVRGHTGVAPVTKETGKHRTVQIRRLCNKQWRNALHLFAWCSTRFSPWAHAFYQYHKKCGDTHSTALRKLADKWLGIIMRMIETGQPYDEAKHLKVLERTHSPVWQYMQAQNGG